VEIGTDKALLFWMDQSMNSNIPLVCAVITPASIAKLSIIEQFVHFRYPSSIDENSPPSSAALLRNSQFVIVVFAVDELTNKIDAVSYPKLFLKTESSILRFDPVFD
jgi:hypothetical protein